jgi:hypothetical protein
VPGTTVVNQCDDCTTEIALPFAVALYDQTFSNVRINSNGALEFNNDLADYENKCLPAPGYSYAIFPYWDDLVTDRTARTESLSPRTELRPIVSSSLNGAHRPFNDFDGTRPANFEVLFYEGKPYFEMVYGQLPDGRGVRDRGPPARFFSLLAILLQRERFGPRTAPARYATASPECDQ